MRSFDRYWFRGAAWLRRAEAFVMLDLPTFTIWPVPQVSVEFRHGYVVTRSGGTTSLFACLELGPFCTPNRRQAWRAANP